MTTVTGYLKKVRKASASLEADILSAVKIVEIEMLELQLEDQLFQGLDNEGNIIGVYSRATEEMTRGMTGKGYPKKAGEPFNFFDTGDAFRSAGYRLFGTSGIEIFLRDSKAPKLMKLARGKLLGLTPENEIKFNFNLLLPVVRSFVKRHIQT